MEQESEYSEFVKGLIDAVREQPCIYDKKHVFYFNKFEREKAWCKVAEQLGQTVDDCQKRWKLLRERLAKELKKRERALANDQNFQSEWSCFEKIVFIEDHIVRRRRHHPYFSLPNDFHDKLVHTLSDSNQSSASSSYTNDVYHHSQQLQLRQTEQLLQNQRQKQTSDKIVCQRNTNRNSLSEFILPTDNTNKHRNSNNNRNNNERSNIHSEVSNNITNSEFDSTTIRQDIKEEPSAMIDLDSDSDGHDIIYESGVMTDRHKAMNLLQASNGQVLPRIVTTQQSVEQDQDQSVTLPTSTTVPENESKANNIIPRTTTQRHTGGAEDSDTLFGQMVTAMLKEIPFEVDKDNAKVYIMQMLIKAKCGKY